MRAPVYRHIEGKSTLLGISLVGFLLLGAFAFGAIQVLGSGSSLVAVATAYAALRLLGLKKPPLYWQHWGVFHFRRLFWGGRLSAAARSRAPEFPFALMLWRDRAPTSRPRR